VFAQGWADTRVCPYPSLLRRYAQFIKKLKSYQSDEELVKYQRYFKFDKDNQSQDDYFIGVRMGQVFQLAKEFIEMVPAEIETLLESPIHEVRVGGVSIMDWQIRSKKTAEARRQKRATAVIALFGTTCGYHAANNVALRHGTPG
jgi:hypothetical protein